MRVSQYFGLGQQQPELDFVDVDVVNDTRLYVDPRALMELDTDWANQAVSLIQGFFSQVLALIQNGDATNAKNLLLHLREPNETHLGQSRGRSRGRALGRESATDVYDALVNSEAARSGLLEDLEDAVLVIPGIDKDIVSDIATNIIRGPLITYTQQTCEYYKIPMQQVDSGPVWNNQAKVWTNGFTELPVANGIKLLLIPKTIVRKRLQYDGPEYYQHYILNYLQEHELAAGSNLIQLLKNGRQRVTKKSIKEKYGTGKPAAARITQDFPAILDRYREAKRSETAPPLTHKQLAEVAGFEEPDFEALGSRIFSLDSGPANATKYHHAVESLLSAMFYPALTDPVREFKIHDGRKRIDIRYSNEARSGFFQWLSQHYAAQNIFVECKNYSRELGNPEMDQVSGRFAPHRGRVGILLYRGYGDKAQIWQSCIDTAHDDRGWIIPLDDNDLKDLIEERKNADLDGEFRLLRQMFDRLIM